MIKAEALKNKIQESGLKKSFVADKLGISAQGLLNKLDGKSEFKISEIQLLKQMLALSADETRDIFLL